MLNDYPTIDVSSINKPIEHPFIWSYYVNSYITRFEKLIPKGWIIEDMESPDDIMSLKRGIFKLPASLSFPLESKWLKQFDMEPLLKHLSTVGNQNDKVDHYARITRKKGDPAIRKFFKQYLPNVLTRIKDQNCPTRLSVIADYEGKSRVIAVPCHTLQLMLKQYHKEMMMILRRIPEDYSWNQDRASVTLRK